jgi:hypothetical protein
MVRGSRKSGASSLGSDQDGRLMEEHADQSASGAGGPGEHSITFHHPAGSVPGVLRIEAALPPSGIVFDLPLPEDGAIRDADGGYRGHGFPAVEQLPVLTATLRSNLPVRLQDVTLSHWMSGHARIDAAVAMVGWAVDERDGEPTFDCLRLQITGLGQFIGTRPLSHIKSPSLFQGETPDEVTIGFAADSDLEWIAQDLTLRAIWATSIAGLGDWYHFEVKSAPWIQIVSATPKAWEYWLDKWVRPLIDLSALATGGPQRATMVEMSRESSVLSDTPRRVTARVFGSGITQAPFSVRFAHHRRPLFVLRTIPYGLDDLVRRWTRMRAELTGFVDLYLPIIRGSEEPPAATILLLSAAAEAIHTARRGQGPTVEEDHREHRRQVLAQLTTVLSRVEMKFLTRHLSRSDRFSLEDRLTDLVSDCPPELRLLLTLDEMPAEVVALRNDLAHGRAVPGDKLEPATRKLRATLNVHLLIELGLPTDPVVEHERWEP